MYVCVGVYERGKRERKSERVYLFIYSMLCILFIRNFRYVFTLFVCMYVCMYVCIPMYTYVYVCVLFYFVLVYLCQCNRFINKLY